MKKSPDIETSPNICERSTANLRLPSIRDSKRATISWRPHRTSMREAGPTAAAGRRTLLTRPNITRLGSAAGSAAAGRFDEPGTENEAASHLLGSGLRSPEQRCLELSLSQFVPLPLR